MPIPPHQFNDRQPLFAPTARPRKLLSFARLTALAAAVSGLCFGYEIGIVDAVLAMPTFQAFFATNASVDGWIVSSFLMGCLFGTSLVSFAADRYGRKPCLLVGASLFVLGGAAQTAAGGVASLCLGRALSGSGIGILSMAAPLYICEVAAPAERGALIALQQLLITVGILAASIANAGLYTLGGALGDAQWRAALAAQTAPGLLLLLLAAPLPRSPRWLVMVGRGEEAAGVLARLREAEAGSEGVLAELAGIRAELGGEGLLGGGEGAGAVELGELGGSDTLGEAAPALGGRAALASLPTARPPPALTLRAYCARVAALFEPGMRRRTLVVCGLQFFQQWTGINVILYFAARLFERAGADATHAATSLVVANAALLVAGTLISMRLIDAPGVGRRALLLYGAAAMAACHGCVALFVGLADRVPQGSAGGTALSTLAVGCMLGFTLAFSATWGPVVWVLQNEMLPLHVRAQGCALGTAVCVGRPAGAETHGARGAGMSHLTPHTHFHAHTHFRSNWASNAVIGKVAPLLIEAISEYTFALYGVMCAAMLLFVALSVRETAGVALEDMEALYGGGDAALGRMGAGGVVAAH